MKKIICLGIILTMVISILSMVTFADELIGTIEPVEAQLGGATIIATDRAYRASSPSQNITAAIQEGGMCNYYVSGYVRLLQIPDKPVAVGIGCEVKNSTTTKWPQTSKITIEDTQWHKITGTWQIKIDDITSAKTFAEVLYSGMSGDAGAYLGDMEWDAITVCRIYDDGSYGENILVNPDMNVDANGEITGWIKNLNLTTTSSVKIPEQDGGALLAEERSSATSGPSQTLTGRFEKDTKYLYTAYVRLIETPASLVNIAVGVELTLNDAGVGWPATDAVSINDTEWHKISGTISTSKDFDRAVTFINTNGNKCDIEIDAVSLLKQDVNGLYSENIILNPAMECDEKGVTADWGCYSVATVTNTGYVPEIIEGGVENPDGTISYPDGNVPADDKNIVYSGRFYDKDGTSKQAAFESYMEIKFSGKSISAMAGSSGNVYYELDGVLNYDVVSLANLKLRNLTDDTHVLRIYANAQQSCFIISGFVIDKGGKTFPITQAKKIEFIGDSITEGYVDPSDKDEKIANNSYLNSYALKAGRMLNKEYGWSFNTVAFGGIGLVRVNNGDPLTMGERYFLQREYVKSTDGTTRESALNAVGEYDYNYVPDYIVINLGTNDGTLSSQEFFENYVEFIKDLKKAYPNVVIFCMTPFNSAKEYYIKEVAREFNKDVYVIDSAQWGIKEGKDVHPAPASLDEAAEKLFAVLCEYAEKGSLPKIEALNAKQLSITSDMQYGFAYFRATGFGLTADMADENGYIERSYTIQNVGQYDAKMRVLWQSDWIDIKDSTAVIKTIKIGESQTFTIKLKIDENGQIENVNGEKADLSNVSFRVEFTNSSTSGSVVYAGTSCIISPDDPNDITIAEINQASVYKDKEKGTGTCAYKGINVTPKDKIIGATVDIGASLTINYFADVNSSDSATMCFTASSGKVTEVEGIFDEETGYFKFVYTGINPQCMNDNICAELICGGEVTATKESYSVKIYCENQISKTASQLDLTENQYNKLQILLADMLVYGSASQEYRDYNVSALPDNEAWVQEYKSSFTVPEGVRRITGNADGDNKALSAGLNMANINKIYFKLKLTDNVVVKLNDVEVDKSALIKNADGTYTLYSNDIKATQFDDVFTLTITKDDEEITKVEYNVNAYIQSKHEADGLAKIVKALSNYGKSAKDFAASLVIVDGDFNLEEDIL